MDLSKWKYAVLGGDRRQSELARILRRQGYVVDTFGLTGEVDTAPNWQTVLARADCLLLPLPMTHDGVRLFCEGREVSEKIRLNLLVKCGKKILFAGKIPSAFRLAAEAGGTILYDYFDSESLQVLNALPTAEGAIFTAMRELPVTIFDSRMAVIGYGRIGRLLTERLTSLGAKVTVYERQEERHAFIRFSGATPSSFSDVDGKNLLGALPKDCRAVFNTVPKELFTRDVLKNFPKDCLFIDLASPPGGLDPSAADELGIHRIWATALPGKYAPESAASYLAEEILSKLKSSVL